MIPLAVSYLWAVVGLFALPLALTAIVSRFTERGWILAATFLFGFAFAGWCFAPLFSMIEEAECAETQGHSCSDLELENFTDAGDDA